MSKVAWWERYSVPVTAAGVVVSMLGLVWTGARQVSVSRDQAAATAVAIEVRIRDELVDGARRFEAARDAGNVKQSEFERNNLLFRIEVYQRDLERLGVVDGSMQLPVGVLKSLATGFCGEAELAGHHFQNLGFPIAGGLADKFEVRTPGRPCPQG